MSLYDELIEWVEGRPWWQQRVVARLAAGEHITPDGCEKIATSLLSPPPAPPAGGWLSGLRQPAETVEDQVRLVAVRGVKHVNRLRPDEVLTFGGQGVTVVFGYNGSGKSGYARLIKQLVRTRHREEILPDVFDGPGQTCEGRLDYSAGDVAMEADLAQVPPLPLGRVAFYDEKCGNAYLTTESEIAYRPSVLTLLDDLYDVCDGVRRALDEHLTANARDAVALPSVPTGSPSGEFIDSLGPTTSDDEIDAACAVPADHHSALEHLDVEGARLRSTDPQRERTRLTSLAAAAEALSQHLTQMRQSLGDDRASQIRALIETANAKRVAADMASTASFDSEPLTGVGSDTWRSLWEAARRFSQSAAYPQASFPYTDASAHCVLCQQPFSKEARHRLHRFGSFMTDDTEQQAELAEADLEQALQDVTAIEVEPAAVTVALTSLADGASELRSRVESALASFRARQTALIAKPVGDHQPDVLTGVLLADLSQRAQKHRDEAQKVSADDFAEQTRVVSRKRRELVERVALAATKEKLIAERDRLARRRRIEDARKQTATTGLTTKISDLTRKYVTVAVQDRFSRESDRLRVERVTLQDKRGRQGALLHKPDFIGATVSADLPRVLSEGEQTALGLAGFFTEAHFDSSRSALVLDDPVTSLDHERRGRVAGRLVGLAKERQVIVFTHDAVFTAEIKRSAGEENVDFVTRTVERGPADRRPGACRDDHPWAVKDAKARLGALRQDLVRIRKHSADWDSETYDREVAMWAGNLSETWERFISQDVADSLVNRGTLEVQVTMMKVVASITPEDNKQFQESYKRCSRWARRHDKDSTLNYVAPPVDELEQELSLVEKWFNRVRKYKN